MNVKITVSYDGTTYCGWQTQPNGVTIQQTIEDALFTAFGQKIKIVGSGRTDAGVHARGQVASFYLDNSIPPEKIYKAVNCFLPNDIRVLDSRAVKEDFNALKSAKKKTYSYSFYLSKSELPLIDRYAVKLDRLPDLNLMKKCADLMVGERDFKCFNASGGGAKSTVRTVYKIEIKQVENRITVLVTGNGFLYNMVRTMVGTILAVGQGEKDLSTVEEMLEKGNRNLCGKTLPAKGLCLEKVEYNE